MFKALPPLHAQQRTGAPWTLLPTGFTQQPSFSSCCPSPEKGAQVSPRMPACLRTQAFTGESPQRSPKKPNRVASQPHVGFQGLKASAGQTEPRALSLGGQAFSLGELSFLCSIPCPSSPGLHP